MSQTLVTTAPPRTRLGLEQLEDRATPATLPTNFIEAATATGLSGPTAMEIAPNGDLWVLEQGGAVKRFVAGSTTADVVGNVSNLGLHSEGERGLLGIAFNPSYATNKFVYLYYTSSDAPDPHNRVSRFKVDDTNPADYRFVDTAANPAVYDEVEILNIDPLSAATNHNGGAIHFGPDGKLYVATGDNADSANAQSLATRKGKILRINADGTIPADNPTSFAGVAGTTSGANRAIWALGLRNPFTFTFDPDTNAMFINDVGQGTWEEINVGGAGRNFGWPATEGDFNQASFPSFTRPRYTYSHGGGTFQGFAITGGAFYSPTTDVFPAEYAGDYFFADFVNGWINVMNADGTDVRRFATDAGGVVDLKVTHGGNLLYLSRANGKVFEVTFPDDQPPSITDQPDAATITAGKNATFFVEASGSVPLGYQWQKLNGGTWEDLANGGGVSGATTARLVLAAVDAADEGQYRAVVTNAIDSTTSDAATLTVVPNQAPSATISITAGLTNGKFIAGQAISFSGTATDPEDGGVPASAFTWKVEYLTNTSGTPTIHPFVAEFSGTRTGSFTPAVTGAYTLADVAYRVTLTVRDSLGTATTQTFDVLPNVANLTIQASLAGLGLTLDGQPVASGTVFQSVVGFRRAIGAAPTQAAGGFTYTFSSWTDGGAATHTILTPAKATTYTARYSFVARINFQPAGSATPAGYFADSGAVFANRGNGYSYGWNAAITNTARDRNSPLSPDQRFDTLVQTQTPANPDAVWELAVPNGTYRVHAVAGDPIVTTGRYRIDAEGFRVVNGLPSSTTPWIAGTVIVTVTDGRLTLRNAPGARDTRLAFVNISRLGPVGLVALYRLDEGSGTSTANVAGGAPAKLLGGVTWTTGPTSAGLAFNGSTGRVLLASSLSQWLGTTGSLSFRIRTTQTGNNSVALAPGVLGSSATDANDSYWGWLDASGRIGVQAGDTPGAKSANPINDGLWHHVVLTRNAATGVVEVYVDGSLSGSATGEMGTKSATLMTIGRMTHPGATNAFFAGALDELTVFNRVLTAAEVQSLS